MTSSSSRRNRPSPLYLLLFLLAAGVLYLYQGGHLAGLGLSPQGPVISVEAGTWIKTLFTAPDFEDLSPHEGGLDALLAADIEVAQQQVDVAAFDFDLESVKQALLSAHRRGVRVRMVVDDENLEDERVAAVMEELTEAGIPVVYDQRNAFMHDKFVIIDGRIVWTGSWNLTDNGTYRNNNNVLRITLPELAQNYEAEFEEMFVDASFGPRSPDDTPYPTLVLSDGSRIENLFAPEGAVRAAIIAQLRQADEEILFLAYSFTDDEIAQVLLEKARAGVRVRGVYESRGASTEYSTYDLLKSADLEVRLDGNPRVMHHKVFVIDGRVTITGSYNFSASAAQENDENVLIVENPDLAYSYSAEFARIYAAGQEE